MLDKVRARIARHKARLNDAKTQRRIGESTSPSNFSTLPPAREDPIVEDEDDGDIPTDALMLRMRIRKLLGGHADSPVSDPPSDSSAEGEDEANGADDASTNINRGSSSILSALKVNVDADLNTAADADPESDSDDVDNSDGSAGEDEVSGTRAGDQNGSAAAALPDTDSHEESFTESETDVSDDESEENWQSRSHRTCRSWFRAMRQMQDKLEELQRHSDAMALKREADADQPTADDQQFPTRTQILSHCFTLAEERAQQEEDEERKARRSNRLSSSPLSTAQVSV